MEFRNAPGLFFIVFLIFGSLGCSTGPDKKLDGLNKVHDGFDSPKALVGDWLEMRRKASVKFISVLSYIKFVSPADRQVSALHNMESSLLLCNLSDNVDDSRKAWRDLKAKFNIPESYLAGKILQQNEDLHWTDLMQDEKMSKEIAAEIFTNVDTKEFLIALFELDYMKDWGKWKWEGPKISAVEGIKEAGERATVTVLLDNGLHAILDLNKIEGRWYMMNYKRGF